MGLRSISIFYYQYNLLSNICQFIWV